MRRDDLCVAAIRSTVIDGINKANSGHPGMSIGSAPIMYTLFSKHLIADPEHPNWFNRDRFVLSAGHASMLLYTMLHVAGYQITMDDLKNFRQLDSITPGHPEIGVTPGVDASAGPLGQGIAQSVGIDLLMPPEELFTNTLDKPLYIIFKFSSTETVTVSSVTSSTIPFLKLSKTLPPITLTVPFSTPSTITFIGKSIIDSRFLPSAITSTIFWL